jgi:hypothetical protein
MSSECLCASACTGFLRLGGQPAALLCHSTGVFAATPLEWHRAASCLPRVPRVRHQVTPEQPELRT